MSCLRPDNSPDHAPPSTPAAGFAAILCRKPVGHLAALAVGANTLGIALE